MTIPQNWPRPRRVYNRAIARAETVRALADAAVFLACRRRAAWPAAILNTYTLTPGSTTTIRMLAQLGPVDLLALVVLHIYTDQADARPCQVDVTCGSYSGQTRAALGKGDNTIEVLIQLGDGEPAAPSIEELTIEVAIGAGAAYYQVDSLLVQPLPMGQPWSE